MTLVYIKNAKKFLTGFRKEQNSLVSCKIIKIEPNSPDIVHAAFRFDNRGIVHYLDLAQRRRWSHTVLKVEEITLKVPRYTIEIFAGRLEHYTS